MNVKLNFAPVRGEVSNRLIVMTGVAVILVVCAVPLGWLLWPRIVKFLQKPERLVLVFEEGFEGADIIPNTSSGTPLPDGWQSPYQQAGGKYYGLISDKVKRSGKYSALLDCDWLTAASSPPRAINVLYILSKMYCVLDCLPPIVVEYDVMPRFRIMDIAIGTPKKSQAFGTFAIGDPEKKTWLCLFFSTDGTLHIGGDKEPITSWEQGKWYHVKVRYELIVDECKITAEIGSKKRTFKMSIGPDEKYWKKTGIYFSAGCGRVWIDNIRVYKVVR